MLRKLANPTPSFFFLWPLFFSLAPASLHSSQSCPVLLSTLSAARFFSLSCILVCNDISMQTWCRPVRLGLFDFRQDESQGGFEVHVSFIFFPTLFPGIYVIDLFIECILADCFSAKLGSVRDLVGSNMVGFPSAHRRECQSSPSATSLRVGFIPNASYSTTMPAGFRSNKE